MSTLGLPNTHPHLYIAKRLVRLLKIMQEIERRPGVLRAELSEELGISTHTISEDIRILRMAGIRIRPGRLPGYWIEDDPIPVSPSSTSPRPPAP